MSYSFPPAAKHGEIEQLFDNIYLVTGSVRLPGPLPVQCSRNMTIVKQGDSLCLINSMRLNPEGLEALDQLGKVEHVIRIAGFHGMDDPFYKDRYGAKVWSVKGAAYASGFNKNPKAEDCYFEADEVIESDTTLPIQGARAYTFEQEKLGEALIWLDHEGGIIVSGDALQHWHSTDEFFNLPAKGLMRLMGFIKPHNVGPGWVKMARPRREDIQGILDIDFDSVLPVHGTPVLGGAREAFRRAIERVS